MLPMADVINGCCKALIGVNLILGSKTKMFFRKSYKFSLSVLSTSIKSQYAFLKLLFYKVTLKIINERIIIITLFVI